MGVASSNQGSNDSEDDGERNPAELIEQPAKVMRIGSMIKQLLEEVRSAPLDEAGRARLAEIHERSLVELEQGLAPELVEELRRIALPFGDGTTPSDAELRIAQAQLVGWLEGLFHGIQTALVAQQMAARAQLEQMRRALPAGATVSDAASTELTTPGYSLPGSSPADQHTGTGQYL
ncbi:MAG: bacterial proteasome activator family protein [Actinomycetota bacterium]